METVATFVIPDPMEAPRTLFAYQALAVSRMAALDATRAEPDEVRDLAVKVATEATSAVLHLIDGHPGEKGYYLMPHNEASLKLPNLSGSLAKTFDSLFDDIDS